MTHLLTDDAWEANGGATVTVFGVRAGVALHPRVRLETEIMHSRNAQSDFLQFNPDVSSSIRSRDSAVTVSHLFAAVRLALSVTPPTWRFQARLAAGPTWINHSSSATPLITATKVIGGSFGVNLVQRVGRNVGIGADVIMNMYSNRYKMQVYPPDQGTRFTHHDLMITGGLTIAVGRRPGYGWDSGPQLAPRHAIP